MYGLAIPELIIGLIVILGVGLMVYSVHRRNQRNKKPPKIWAAILLSFFPTPVHGVLYARGIVAALVSSIIIMAALLSFRLYVNPPLSFETLSGDIIESSLIMAVVAGVMAKKERNKLKS